MGMSPDEVTAFGKPPRTVASLSLLCFWAHRKLGMITIEIAAKLKIGQPSLSRSLKRGENSKREAI